MSKDHIEMALKSVEAFQNGGRIDATELQQIIDIAERDGAIDQDEIRVLRSIISRVDPAEVGPELVTVMQSPSKKIEVQAKDV